jgi:hypothetical protein
VLIINSLNAERGCGMRACSVDKFRSHPLILAWNLAAVQIFASSARQWHVYPVSTIVRSAATTLRLSSFRRSHPASNPRAIFTGPPSPDRPQVLAAANHWHRNMRAVFAAPPTIAPCRKRMLRLEPSFTPGAGAFEMCQLTPFEQCPQTAEKQESSVRWFDTLRAVDVEMF